MSLTNPNKVVTEERLSEFYQGIFPYLGGMPEMVANKFSKSDIYSTDEKIIGLNDDGKPLYQISYTGVLSGSYDTEKTLIDNTLLPSNIDIGYIDIGNSFVEYPPYGTRSSIFIYGSTAIAIWYNGTNIRIKTSGLNSDLSGGKYRAVLRYTKTTDSPIAIGSDTDYSTDEKIVGTWIDGKSIWQKTFINTLPNTNSNGTLASKYVEVGVSVNEYIDYKGGVLAADDVWVRFNSTAAFIYCYGNNNSTNPNSLRINNSNVAWNGKPVKITVQYTKTS